MRVLLGMPDKGSWGGPIYCEPPFAEALRLAGVEADEEVYVYGESATPVSFLQRIRRVIEAARRMRRRTREKQYDIIHLNTSFDERCVMRDLVTLTFLRSSGVPIHLKMHGSTAGFLRTKNAFWRFLQRRVFSLVDNVGVLSTEERDNFLNAGCPPAKLSDAKYVVGGEFRKDAVFRSHHGLDADTPILLFSSRFYLAKGLLDAISACHELKQAGRDFVLFCLGDGPIRQEAEDLARELQLGQHIRFTGYVPESDTTTFHANSTIFVFPTYHDEGFPLVILKSLAAGLPIITTKIRAAADYMTEPENCLWTLPKDPHGLAAKITQLLDDPELQTSMSANNRSLAEKFTGASVAREYIELYRTLIDRQKDKNPLNTAHVQ